MILFGILLSSLFLACLADGSNETEDGNLKCKIKKPTKGFLIKYF